MKPHLILCAIALCSFGNGNAEPIEIGNRRELFVDDFLIEQMAGKAELRLHHPVAREVVLVLDEPWEGSGSSGYQSVFRDGDIYRMYYKGWQIDLDSKASKIKSSPSAMCYAESNDGIEWRKPSLGLVEFNGSKDNNIILRDGPVPGMNVIAGLMAVTKDANPNAAPEARYKGFVLSTKPRGIAPFQSADGLKWVPMTEKPVITDGAFDNQNVVFWNPNEKKYRAYWRYFSGGDNDVSTPNPEGVRAIRTAVSDDFLTWEEQENLTYEDSPEEALYNTPIKPYDRAPHLLVGFPARYVERDFPSSKRLPEPEHRALRKSINPRYGTAITEGLFMSSRDGVHFKRWNEAFLRPGPERPGTWNYGHQFIAWQPVETKSLLPGAPNELSFYAPEDYWTGKSTTVRRYTLRLDGFVSLHAPMEGGKLTTKPLTFTGDQLSLNFSTSAAGEIRIELQKPDGAPYPGFSLEDCPPIFGDHIDRVVDWAEDSDLGSLAGKEVRIRFFLKDADLFSFRFQ